MFKWIIIVNTTIFGHYSHVNVSAYVAGDSRIDGIIFIRTEQCALRCRAVRVRFISLFVVCEIEFDLEIP